MAATNALGRTCGACGKEHKTSHLAFDPETLLPYCTNPYICNVNHPNSPTNLIKRGAEVLLVTYAQANAAHEKQLLEKYDPTIIVKIQKLIVKPITVRVQDPDMAKFLIELQEQMSFPTMSDTMRYCVQLLQESKGMYYKEYKQMQEDEETVAAVEKATKVTKPRKVKEAKEENIHALEAPPTEQQPIEEEEEISL